MSDKTRSPKILAVCWGRMEVEGIGAGKDFKLYPGGGREWDWNETGTRHSPASSLPTWKNSWPTAPRPSCCPWA